MQQNKKECWIWYLTYLNNFTSQLLVEKYIDLGTGSF